MSNSVEYVSLDRFAPARTPFGSEKNGQNPSTIDADDLSDHRLKYVVQRVTNHRLVNGEGITKRRLKLEYKALWYDSDNTWNQLTALLVIS